MRWLALTSLLASCGGETLMPERQICRSSLECPRGMHCIAERCRSADDNELPRYGQRELGCEDLDGDGEGIQLSGTQRLLSRQVCPDRPDRYWTTAHQPLRAQVYLVRSGEATPELVLAARDVSSPRDRCGAGDIHCSQAQVGILNNLTAQAVRGSLGLHVHASDEDLEPYEMVVQVGRSCTERIHCASNTSRCIRPVAISTGQADLGGVCVFDSELPVSASCDGASDRSSDNPEHAPHLGDLRSLRMADIPICADDEDWYAFSLAEGGTFPVELVIRSVRSDARELAKTFVHVALHRSLDLAPVFVANLGLEEGVSTVQLVMPRLAAGDYHLRLVQLSRRQLASTYSLRAGPF